MTRHALLLLTPLLLVGACASPAPRTSFGAGALVPGAVRISDTTTIPASLRAGTVDYVRVARRLDPLPSGSSSSRTAAAPHATTEVAAVPNRFRVEAPPAHVAPPSVRVETPVAAPAVTRPPVAIRTEPAELRPMAVPTGGARAAVPAPTTMPTTPSIVVSGRRPVAPTPPAVRPPVVRTDVATQPAPSTAELEAAAVAARKEAQAELERGVPRPSRLRRRTRDAEVEAPPRPGAPLPAPRPVRPLDLTEFEQRTRRAQ